MPHPRFIVGPEIERLVAKNDYHESFQKRKTCEFLRMKEDNKNQNKGTR